MKKTKLFIITLILNSTFLILNCSAQPIYTYAGDGTMAYSGDGGPATSASLSYPEGVAVDAAGNVYIADYGNNKVRKISTSGIISTIAGMGGGYSGDGGLATNADLYNPAGVAVDGAGNLYIADCNNSRIRKINTSGIISTFAGTGVSGFNGDGVLATNAQIANPTGVAVDAAGNVYIADCNNSRIRKVDISGYISTIGYAMSYPQGVAVDAAGNVYVADRNNNMIRKINTSGIMTTIAGNGASAFSGDGAAATAAGLNFPTGVAVDAAGNVYIADKSNQRIRKVNTLGIISTLAGNGTGGFSGDGGPAADAMLYIPTGVAADAAGNVYIGDRFNHRIRKVSACDVIVTSTQTNVSCYSGNNGAADVLASGGTGTFNYIWAPISNITASASALTAGAYTCTVTDANNCAVEHIITITQPNEIITSVSKTDVSCYGGNNGTATVSASGGTGVLNYIWAPSGGTSALASGLSIGTYTCTITDVNLCTKTEIITITQPLSPLSIGDFFTNASCNNNDGSAGITVSGGTLPYSYLWSNSGTASTVSGIGAGTYSVTATDSKGCTIVSSIIINNSILPPSPVICMVTVDDISVNNIIYWDKTSYTNADSFIVYRETISNTYKRIGAVSVDSMSLLIDTVKALYFPFTGNPNAGTYRYRLQVRDVCGNYSPLSLYHNTIYTTQTGGTFNWNDYKIEGQSIPISQLSAYMLSRDNNSTGTWAVVGGVSGTQTTVTDPNYATYPNASWRIETIWSISCTPTRAAVNTTRSNIKHQSIVTGINSQESIEATNVYPNPANDYVSIEFAASIQKANLKIMNSIGQVVYEQTVVSSGNSKTIKQITTGNFAKGVYIIIIESNMAKTYKKLVIN